MQGFTTTTGVILLSVLNVYETLEFHLFLPTWPIIYNRFSTIGRLIAGGVADRYGRVNTQTTLILFGATAIFVIWLPFGDTLPGLYVFSAVFGLASGSFLSLAPACIGQISKASEVGGRFGICYSIVGLAYVSSSYCRFPEESKLLIFIFGTEPSFVSRSAGRCSRKSASRLWWRFLEAFWWSRWECSSWRGGHV